MYPARRNRGYEVKDCGPIEITSLEPEEYKKIREQMLEDDGC